MILKRCSTAIPHSKNAGFTIVEMVTVLFVVALLAALVVVAYGGVQERSRNTQRIGMAKQWYDILSSYHNAKGAFPDTFALTGIGDRYVCLGKNNPDSNGDGTGDCLNYGAAVDQSAAFNTAVSSMSSIPDGSSLSPIKDASNRGFRGIIIVTESLTTIDGRVWPYMTFALEGQNQDCVIADTIVQTAAGDPHIYVTKDTAPTKGGFTPGGSNITLCNIPLHVGG